MKKIAYIRCLSFTFSIFPFTIHAAFAARDVTAKSQQFGFLMAELSSVIYEGNVFSKLEKRRVYYLLLYLPI